MAITEQNGNVNKTVFPEGFTGADLRNADVNLTKYGDDSSMQNYDEPHEWGGQNNKYTGEGTKNTTVAYNPNIKTSDLDPNYKYGGEAQAQNSQEAGYITSRNDNIASALYNEGRTDINDVADYLNQQNGFQNSNENERQNTIYSVWKRLGQIEPKNENKSDENAESTNTPSDEQNNAENPNDKAINDMNNELNGGRNGEIYGKITGDKNSDEAIKTLEDQNSVYNMMNQGRIDNVKNLQSMNSQDIATSIYMGTTPYGSQAMRDLMQFNPAKYQEIQAELKKIKAEANANAISSGEYDDFKTVVENKGTANSELYDFADSNANSNTSSYDILKSIKSTLKNNSEAGNAEETLSTLEENMSALKQRLKNLPKEAKSAFKSDVPQYLVNAYIANRTQEIQNELSSLESRYNMAYSRYQDQVKQAQRQAEFNLKSQEFDYKRESDAINNYFKSQDMDLKISQFNHQIEKDAYQIEKDKIDMQYKQTELEFKRQEHELNMQYKGAELDEKLQELELKRQEQEYKYYDTIKKIEKDKKSKSNYLGVEKANVSLRLTEGESYKGFYDFMNDIPVGTTGYQCGAYVRVGMNAMGVVGLPDDLSSLKAKESLINTPAGYKPQSQDVIIMESKKYPENGHIAFVVRNNENGTIRLRDANRGDDETVHERDISPTDARILGYWSKSYINGGPSGGSNGGISAIESGDGSWSNSYGQQFNMYDYEDRDELTSVEKAAVRAILDYQKDPTGLPKSGANGESNLKITTAAAEIGRKYGYREDQYAQASKAVQLFDVKAQQAGGELSRNSTAMDTLMGLYSAYSELNNVGEDSSFFIIPAQLQNQIGNKFAEWYGLPAITRFDALVNAISSETAGALKGNASPSESDTKEVKGNFSSNKSPEQMNATIEEYAETLWNKMKSEAMAYKNTTGRKPKSIYVPEVVEWLKSFKDENGKPKFDVAAYFDTSSYIPREGEIPTVDEEDPTADDILG